MVSQTLAQSTACNPLVMISQAYWICIEGCPLQANVALRPDRCQVHEHNITNSRALISQRRPVHGRDPLHKWTFAIAETAGLRTGLRMHPECSMRMNNTRSHMHHYAQCAQCQLTSNAEVNVIIHKQARCSAISQRRWGVKHTCTAITASSDFAH